MVVNSDISTKTEIIIGLNDVFDRTIAFCKDQDDNIFDRPLAEGKWSTAQNVEHICIGTHLMTRGMSMPKFMMKATFGTSNRAEKTIDEIYVKYKAVLAAGLKAPERFDPVPIDNDQKVALLEKLDKERHKILKVLGKWDEKALTKYILPHPAIGKLTVREMLMFTIFHTEHHLEIIKRIS